MALDRRVRDLMPVFDSFGLDAPTIPEVVTPEPRLAPEHPCPASTEDAVAACRGLLGEVGA